VGISELLHRRDQSPQQVLRIGLGEFRRLDARLVRRGKMFLDEKKRFFDLPRRCEFGGVDAPKGQPCLVVALAEKTHRRDGEGGAEGLEFGEVDCHPMGGFKPPASAGSFQPPNVA